MIEALGLVVHRSCLRAHFAQDEIYCLPDRRDTFQVVFRHLDVEALVTIKEVAAEVLSVDPDLVTETARFKEDLDADSLDLVELVMGLEERFDIEVPEDDLEGVTTIGQAVDLVLAKVGA